MSETLVKNIGAYFTTRFGGVASFTAGAAGNGDEVVGPWHDRLEYGSCKALLSYTATLGAGESLTLSLALDQAVDDNGAGSELRAELPEAVVFTAPAAGTFTGTVELDVDLGSSGRYVAVRFTPTLSRANTDAAMVSGVIAFGGAYKIPVT